MKKFQSYGYDSPLRKVKETMAFIIKKKRYKFQVIVKTVEKVVVEV